MDITLQIIFLFISVLFSLAILFIGYNFFPDIIIKRFFSSAVIIDPFGIPYVDYKTIDGNIIGIQPNPVAIAQKGLEYFDSSAGSAHDNVQLGLNCADWLVRNIVQKNTYSVWEYPFPWPYYKIPKPWVSGMAQGFGIQLLLKAHSITGNDMYLNTAESALNAFFVDMKDGGVTIKDEDGWWFEEYAHPFIDPAPMVLNGFLFSLIGIDDFYRYTGSENAKELTRQGLKKLLKELPSFDMGNWSYYDKLGTIATIKYHAVHIDLLEKLFPISNNDLIHDYFQKWSKQKRMPLHVFMNYPKFRKTFPLSILVIFTTLNIIQFTIVHAIPII